jgi:hypothetical protein
MEVKILTTTGSVLYWDTAASVAAAAQDAIRKGISLAGADFRGADLRGAILCNGIFTGAHFEGANCIGADFTSANLTNCDFSGALVTEAVWTTATLTGVDTDALATAAVAMPTAGTAIPTTEKAAASGVATLSATSKVVQDPANAQTTAASGKIPIAGVTGAIAPAWIPDVAPTAVDFGVTAPYTVLITDQVIEVTTGAVSGDVDLPLAITSPGRIITIKKVDAGAGTVSVDPNGVEVIEALAGGAPYVLGNIGETVRLQTTGTKWYVLGTTLAPAAHAASHKNAGADPKLTTIRTPAAGACNIATTDEYVRAASTGAGAVAATLYTADAAAVGRVVTVMKVDVNADDVNVTPFGGELINGANALYALAAQWNSVTLLCVAVGQWEIIAAH